MNLLFFKGVGFFFWLFRMKEIPLYDAKITFDSKS